MRPITVAGRSPERKACIAAAIAAGFCPRSGGTFVSAEALGGWHPEHEHEFNEWYNTEHIPALGSAPGTLCARRYRGTGGIQRYVALYHLTSPEVVRSAEWKKAADTPWTQKMRPHFRDHLRIECRRYTRAQ